MLLSEKLEACFRTLPPASRARLRNAALRNRPFACGRDARYYYRNGHCCPATRATYADPEREFQQLGLTEVSDISAAPWRALRETYALLDSAAGSLGEGGFVTLLDKASPAIVRAAALRL